MTPAWPFHPDNPALGLLTAEPPAGKQLTDVADPFLTVGLPGGFSRVLVGEVLGPRGVPVLRLAVKVQSDDYPVPGEGDGTGLTCDAIEAGWEREVAVLEACGPDRLGILAPAEVLSRSPGKPAVLPPTLFCKRRRAFFAAACPECGGPLAEVRDNRLLEERGLPRRDRSLARFVGCPACIGRGDVRLWTLIREPRFGREVGDQGDLVRALGRLARTDGDRVPCQGCEHVPGCYPEGGAAGEAMRLLVPVSFYESRAIATELLDLRYDECVALCGGASCQDVLRTLGNGPRDARLARLVPVLDRPRYLFAHDAAGKVGLEVLRLKVGLFAQLCRATAQLHRQGREPHLGLTPARAMARIDTTDTGLPWAWRLGVHLLGIGSAVARALPVGAMTDLPAVSYARPRHIDFAFAAPGLRDAPRAELPGVFTPRRITPVADGRLVLEGDLEAEGVDLAGATDKDTFDVTVVQGRPPLSLQLVGVPTGREGRAVRLRSVPLALDAGVRDTLGQLIGQPLARARFTWHPCLHVPADVHALGMILFTTLLVRRDRPVVDVARAVDDVVQRLTLAARGVKEGNEAVLVEQAARLLSGEAFDRAHLFAASDGAAAAIPEALWRDLLIVGLRAATTLRGFSICRHAGDFDPGHPEVKVEFLLQMVDGLLRRIDQALFGLPGRERELRAALARVAREIKVE